MAERNLDTSKQFNERKQVHPDGTIEYWRDVPGYEGYYRVSDLGRVKSLGRWILGRGKTKRWNRERICSSKVSKRNPYPTVVLRKNGEGKKERFHILVLLAFVGPKPLGKRGLHWDDNKENNKLSNLRWGSQKENMMDKCRNGNDQDGQNNSKAKLTWDQVRIIRKLSNSGHTRKKLAQMFGVRRTTIGEIVRFDSWKEPK